MSSHSPSKTEHKVHVFHCNVEWTGERTWLIRHEGYQDIFGGPPPVFGGSEGRWSPEDLMLASVNSCHLATFISYSIRKGFEFVSCTSSIEGFLEYGEKGYSFTRMVVKPKVVVKSKEDIEKAREYLEKAHELCFMGNSVRAEIVLEPEIKALDT